jgi:hypothetical protein
LCSFLVVELAFEGILLPCSFMLPGWDLHIWVCFGIGIPVPYASMVGVLWRSIQNWVVVRLWCVFFATRWRLVAQYQSLHFLNFKMLNSIPCSTKKKKA